MSETTDQMSLLDAIGISAPEETKKPKNDTSEKAKASSGQPSRKRPVRTKTSRKSGADPDPIEEVQENASGKTERADGTVSSAVDDSIPDATAPLPLDRYLCFALYSANHAMHGVYKGLLKEIGLTYPQFLAMTVLWETNNVPVGKITTKLQLDTNTLTPLLKRLEAMGLVTRTRNTKDERQVILKLTRKGRALQKKTEHFGTCVLSSTGTSMEEVMDLQGRIMKLRDNLRAAGSS